MITLPFAIDAVARVQPSMSLMDTTISSVSAGSVRSVVVPSESSQSSIAPGYPRLSQVALFEIVATWPVNIFRLSLRRQHWQILDEGATATHWRVGLRDRDNESGRC